MASVEFRNIKKMYNKDIIAVESFTMGIKDKEFVVLVGPSGCGKSTTLRMVAGLEEITEGELFINDQLVNDIAPKDRDIAMVFQNYALYPHMTAYQNMAFALKLRRVKKNEIDQKVRETAEILGITELLQRKPKELSGGQRQRVAIGRAIVRKPQVFLMDEPLSNLDAKLRNQMRAEIIKLRQNVNTTFIYVTHDQTEAMTLGDRIVVMRDGFIQQIGTPQEVFNHPINLFVAGFIGSPQMNFLDAELRKSDEKYKLIVEDASLQLNPSICKRLNDKKIQSQEIILGIRPEHLNISVNDDPIAIHAEVVVTELMGSTILVHLSIHGHSAVMCLPTVDFNKKFGDCTERCAEIDFTFLEETIHMFSKENEINLLV